MVQTFTSSVAKSLQAGVRASSSYLNLWVRSPVQSRLDSLTIAFPPVVILIRQPELREMFSAECLGRKSASPFFPPCAVGDVSTSAARPHAHPGFWFSSRPSCGRRFSATSILPSVFRRLVTAVMTVGLGNS